MCCVQFEEEMNTYYKWQSSLLETNAYKLSRTMIFLTDDQNGSFAHVEHYGEATTKTNNIPNSELTFITNQKHKARVSSPKATNLLWERCLRNRKYYTLTHQAFVTDNKYLS